AACLTGSGVKIEPALFWSLPATSSPAGFADESNCRASTTPSDLCYSSTELQSSSRCGRSHKAPARACSSSAQQSTDRSSYKDDCGTLRSGCRGLCAVQNAQSHLRLKPHRHCQSTALGF